MIDVHFDRSAYRLRVQGHACSAPYGQDLVCAGVSALVATLGAVICEYAAAEIASDVEVRIAPGDTEISCKPKDGEERSVAAVYHTVVTGLQCMAAEYPEYVRCTVV